MGKCLGYHPVSKSPLSSKSGHSNFVLSTTLFAGNITGNGKINILRYMS